MGFKLKAADGTALEIADGDFYFNTKARGRRMMANSLSCDARRVHACLELATMGFQQEECVVAIGKNQTRPLTPTDIKDQTGLSRQNVRRAFEELDDAGLAERRAADGGALRKGQVLIYSWAVPRPPKKEDCSRARLQFPDWFPESWEPLKPLISRFKYSLIDDEVAARDYKEELDAAARAYKEAEIVAIRALERVCAARKRADASLYRKNGKIYKERPSSSAVEPKVQAAKAEEDGSLYKKFKASYPDQPTKHFDEPRAKPLFEGKTKAEQALILERLQIYLTCERWRDEDGRWIPFASKWLESYEADPPPALKKHRSSRQPASDEEYVEYTQMYEEFRQNAVEINDALVNGRPLSKRHQQVMDYLEHRR
jgi:hypothetical protein